MRTKLLFVLVLFSIAALGQTSDFKIKIDDPDEEVISLLSCEMKKSIELESQTDVTSFSLDYHPGVGINIQLKTNNELNCFFAKKLLDKGHTANLTTEVIFKDDSHVYLKPGFYYKNKNESKSFLPDMLGFESFNIQLDALYFEIGKTFREKCENFEFIFSYKDIKTINVVLDETDSASKFTIIDFGNVKTSKILCNMKSFIGTFLEKEYRKFSNSNYVRIRPIVNHNSRNVKSVLKPITNSFILSHLVAKNFDISLQINSKRFFVSANEYRKIEKRRDVVKEGVVVIDGSIRFILATDDLTREKFTWKEAMRRYSDLLPSKDEAKLLHKYKNSINASLKAMNGRLLEWSAGETTLWTKSLHEDGSNQVYVSCFDGNNHLVTDSAISDLAANRCRAIYRF